MGIAKNRAGNENPGIDCVKQSRVLSVIGIMTGHARNGVEQRKQVLARRRSLRAMATAGQRGPQARSVVAVALHVRRPHDVGQDAEAGDHEPGQRRQEHGPGDAGLALGVCHRRHDNHRKNVDQITPAG